VHLDPPKAVQMVGYHRRGDGAVCKRGLSGGGCRVMTAAVCDYRPVKRLRHKLAKHAQPKRVVLERLKFARPSAANRRGDILRRLQNHPFRLSVFGQICAANA